MDDFDILSALIFAEADKNPKKMDKDGLAVAYSVINRTKRPERFGSTIKDVVFAPSQYSGVGSKEWNKFVNKDFKTKEEEFAAKKAMQIAGSVLRGIAKDPTGGADHYFNPKLVKPKWSKKMKKVFASGSHDFYKE